MLYDLQKQIWRQTSQIKISKITQSFMKKQLKPRVGDHYPRSPIPTKMSCFPNFYYGYKSPNEPLFLQTKLNKQEHISVPFPKYNFIITVQRTVKWRFISTKVSADSLTKTPKNSCVTQTGHPID